MASLEKEGGGTVSESNSGESNSVFDDASSEIREVCLDVQSDLDEIGSEISGKDVTDLDVVGNDSETSTTPISTKTFDSESASEKTNVKSEVEKKPGYITPVPDPYEKATKYLEKHQLLMLAQTLTADIVLKRPSDPLDFMIEEIEKLQEQDRLRKGVFLKVSRQEDSENVDKSKDYVEDNDIGEFDKLSLNQE